MDDNTTSPVPRFRADVEALIGPAPARLGVAVSGGPDSLAMLLLAQAAFQGQVEAATVDHGLRPESAGEAKYVARLCSQLGVAHETLRPDEPITGNLQSSARRVRYALLEAWRLERSLDWVLTAHHADDQAETLLMRLNRGAGVGGLSGVRDVNARVLRPLLGWRRAELAGILDEVGIKGVVDPSNTDERFDRALIRRRMAEADWLDPSALARSAQALAEAEEALEWSAHGLAEQRITRNGAGVRLDPSGLPAELRRRLAMRALRCIDHDAAPRGDALGRLLLTLERGGVATLAGVKARGGKAWRFEPAPPRKSARKSG